MMIAEVDILLATYQGAPFLEKQLESLFLQTHPKIRVLGRDDGSTDLSKEILKKWPVFLIEAAGDRGCVANFSALLSHSTSSYIAFSDQDDYWQPYKIEEALQAMRQAEKELPEGTPILVHSDLTVVDHNLKEIAPSFWDYTGLKPHHHTHFNHLLVQNCVTGCAMMINRSLASLAGPIPREAKMHDWWLALVASAFGKIVALNRPSILYRQHASNAIGAQKLGVSRLLKRFFKGDLEKGRIERKRQAQAFLNRYSEKLSEQQKEILSGILQADERSWFQNSLHAYRYAIYRSGALSNTARIFMKNPF